MTQKPDSDPHRLRRLVSTTQAPAWHREAWRTLHQRNQRGALPHALLLRGPTGLGKREFAERLVRGLLCLQPGDDGVACGDCRACKLLDAGSHPDRITVKLELNKKGDKLRREIVVEQIRALSARVSMASQLGGRQIATIDPADGMNASAANALLKTLEEPTAATIIVLVADAPWRLPATIRSRCQRIDLHVPAHADALAWLRDQGVDEGDAEAALDAAGGNPGLARAWADGEVLAQRREVRDDMAALAGGRANVAVVAKRWAGDALSQRLWFAAQAAADEARLRADGGHGALGTVLDDAALNAWYAHANRARDSLRGPLRPDLVVLDLLAQWR